MSARKYSWLLVIVLGIVSATNASGQGLLVLSGSDGVLRLNEQTGAVMSTLVPVSPNHGPGEFLPGGFMKFSPDGFLIVASGGNSAGGEVLRYTKDGVFHDILFGPGQGGLPVWGPDGDMYTLVLGQFSGAGVERRDGKTGAFKSMFIPINQNVYSAATMVFGPDDNLYIADDQLHKVVRFNGQTGAFMDTFVAPRSGGLNTPRSMVFGPDANLYVATYFSPFTTVMRYNGQTGAFMGPFVPELEAIKASLDVSAPTSVLFGPDGKLYLATIDGDQPRLRPVSPVRTDGFTVYVANLRMYHKTLEIQANPKVELCYLDDSHDQVRIAGVAEVLTDAALLREIWDANPLLRQYLRTPENPELVVYRIRPVQVRYMQEWALEYIDVPIDD
jgi:general stress protein 26